MQQTQQTYSLPPQWRGKKYQCPNCGQWSFRPYRADEGRGADFAEVFKDLEDPNARELAKMVGKCDHERQCGWHMKPKEFFNQVKVGNYKVPEYKPKPIVTAKPLNPTLMTKSMPKHVENRSTIEKFWMQCFHDAQLEEWERVRVAYQVGATKDGRIIYWMVDEKGEVRDGKMMAYKEDGHRNKDINPRWIRETSLKMTFPNYKVKGSEDQKAYDELAGQQVLRPYFGTHLLMDGTQMDKPAALVEGEKSALLCATIWPQFVWLAIGTKRFDASKLERVRYQRRPLFLFPDYDGIEVWQERITELNYDKVVFMGDLIDRLHETDNDDIGDIALRWYLRFKDGKVEDTAELCQRMGASEDVVSFINNMKLTIEPTEVLQPF